MSKNDFRKNASEFFISSATDKEDRQPEQTKTEDDAAGIKDINLPRGFMVAPQPKNRHMHILVQQSTADDIKAISANQGISMNELVNRILRDYLERKEAE